MIQTLQNPLHSSLDVDAQPFETFIKSVTAGSAGSLLKDGWLSLSEPGKDARSTYLDKPRPLPKSVQAKLISDLRSGHSIGEILLVGKDKEEGIPELILVQHPLQLLTGLRNTFPIIRIDDENDTLGVLEV